MANPLLGNWRLVEIIGGSGETPSDWTFEFTRGMLVVAVPGDRRTIPYALNETAQPMEIDLERTDGSGRAAKGILQVKGNSLSMILSQSVHHQELGHSKDHGRPSLRSHPRDVVIYQLVKIPEPSE